MASAAAQAADAYLLQLVQKLESARLQQQQEEQHQPMSQEIRTLEFWRAIIAECLAAFFFVFLLCGSRIPWPGYEPTHVHSALACGFAMATLAQCFGHISGGHVNPAVTFALLVTQKVTPLRAALYMTAQCGGAIAGAALLYGVTVPGYQGDLGATVLHNSLSPWQGFGIEFVLTFIIVFTVFATIDPHRRMFGSPSLAVGIAYLVCSLAGFPSTGAAVNPARALGPAFVMNKWTYHWVYWSAPMSGGLLAGLIYEYIFDPRRSVRGLKEALEELDRDSSMQSQDEDYDEPESKMSKFPASQYGSYRPPTVTGPLSSGEDIPATYGIQNTDVPSAGFGSITANPVSNYTTSYGPVQGNGSIYEAAPYRSHSSGSTYASIHGGSRMGSLSRGASHRLDYGPNSTKF